MLISEVTQDLAALKWYDNLSKDVDEMRAMKGKDASTEWPDWCLLPIEVWDFISRKYTSRLTPMERYQRFTEIALLGPWRYSQGIYEFDEDVRNELIKTPIKNGIPSNVLMRLPEWCQYIQVPEYYLDGELIDGFWAALHWSCTNHRPELQLGIRYPNRAMVVLHVILDQDVSLDEVMEYTSNRSVEGGSHSTLM